jgi:hypothetical protein
MTVTVCAVIKTEGEKQTYTGRYEVISSPNTFNKKRNDIDPKTGTRGSLEDLEADYPDSHFIVDGKQGRCLSTGQRVKLP